MNTTVNKNNQIDAYSFMGLMAGEGQIPGTASKPTTEHFWLAEAQDLVTLTASDMTATGDFFTLMVENGMMRAEEVRKPIQIKITRPRGLGGDFGGIGGFGGGALAH